MTGPNDPYQGAWGAPEGQHGWPSTASAQEPSDYPDYPEYQGYPIGYNQSWPPPGPFDGVPQGHAVHPLYPGIPGQGPVAPPKSSKPLILIAAIAGSLVVALAVVTVVILTSRESTPRRTAAAPSTQTGVAAPEPTLPPSVVPTPQPPQAGIPAPVPPPIAAPTPPAGGSAPKAPGQVLAIGDCVALTPPEGYQPLPCTDAKAAFKVFDLHDGGQKCKSAQVGFTAGDFSYCLAPQLRNESCYKTDTIMGATVFVAVDNCGEKGAFRVMEQYPGTTDKRLCDRKPGVSRYFTVADPQMVICAS